MFSLPRLATVSPDESLEALQEKASADPSSSGSSTPTYDLPDAEGVTYTDYDNPWSLAEDGSGSPYITKLSQLAWVACGKDTYVLECMGKGHIKIQPPTSRDTNGEVPKFVATYTPASLGRADSAIVGSTSRLFFRKRDVLTAETLESAVKGCDTYAINKVVLGRLANG